MSKKYTLNRDDSRDIIKVLAWTVASAVVAGLLQFLTDLPVEMQGMIWFPIVNTALVAAKKFLAEKAS